MKALSKLVATGVLLVTLAAFPCTLLAFRQMVHQMAATVPHFASPIEEAEYWAHAFGP